MQSSRRGGSFGGFLMMLLVGGAIGAGLCYYLVRSKGASSDTALEPELPVVPAASSTPAPVPEPAPVPAPAETDENYVTRKLREWKLTPEDLKRELASAGRIVRENGSALGAKVASATSDISVIAKIKTKFALDDQLQALRISVGCKDGHVTLSGTVATHELVGRAIVLALDTTDVVDVVSSLKVEVAPLPPV
jgi:BON domain